MQVAFLDRDGTIVADYPDEVWSGIAVPEFLPGALDALATLRRKGYEIVIVTNQYLIGEGYISERQYRQFAGRLLQTLAEQGIAVLDVFFCPHRRSEGCPCLKPNPGMIEAAMAKYPAIDLDRSLLVGDSPCDAELAERTGLRGFAIGFESGRAGVTRVASLAEAAALA